MALGILDLKEQRELALKNAEALIKTGDAEMRDMSPDESKQYDELMSQWRSLGKNIDQREALQSAKANSEKHEERKTTSAIPASPERRVGRIEVARSSVQLRSFKNYEEAHLAGKWLQGALFGSEEARNYCLDRGLEFRAQAEGTNTKGGYLVPTILDTAIIDNRYKNSICMQECNVKTMSSDHQVIPIANTGLTAYAVGENTEITESEKGWTDIELTARKWGILAKYSSEINEDSIINMAEDLVAEIGLAFALKMDQTCFNGDGTSTYHNILGCIPRFNANDGSWVGAVTAASNHDTFAEIDSADLTKLVGTLPEQYHANAKFYCSRAAWANTFMRLLIASGGATMAEVVSGVRPSYMGYPVVITPVMPTALTDLSNTSMLLFGDMKRACVIGDRRGVQIRTSADRYIELDQIAIVGTTRYDVNCFNLGDTSVAAALVSLQAE